MRPMTFARAMAAEKRGGEVVSVADNTPPAINFHRNSNTSNSPHRNRLVVLTAVVATPTPATTPVISMVKRVMKRAGDMFFSGQRSQNNSNKEELRREGEDAARTLRSRIYLHPRGL